MSENIDERVYHLLQYLAWAVSDAALEYEHTSAAHTFVIIRLQLKYSLTFPEKVLQTAPFGALKEAIAPAIDRILLGASPRRVLVGCWQAAGMA